VSSIHTGGSLQRRGDVAPQRVKVDSCVDQDPNRQTLPFAEQTKQDVTVGDVLLAQPHRLPQGQLNDLLGPGVKGM
jgi:hypothetical protein